jgi:hypothetical protein
LTFGVVAAVAATSSSGNNIEPGVLGFLVVAGTGAMLVFLLRSMNKQFRKIAPDASGASGASGGPEAGHAEEPASGPGTPG